MPDVNPLDYVLTTAPPPLGPGNYVPPSAGIVKAGETFGVNEEGTLIVPELAPAQPVGGMMGAYARDEATITRNTLDQWGEPTGTPQTIIVRGRWEHKTRIVRDNTGQQVVASSVFYTAADVRFTDIVTRAGVEYKPLSIDQQGGFSSRLNVVYFA